MEKGEGSNQFPYLQESEVLDGPVRRGPVRPVGPSFTTVNNVSAVAAAAAPAPVPGNSPVRRRHGRPEFSEQGSRREVKKRDNRPILCFPNFEDGISEEDRETGNAELVTSVLMRFDAVRRRLCQNGTGKGDFTVALDTFKSLGLRTNLRKRIGSVPGVDVGDIFYSRGEMCLVGLHVATIGIEFMGIHENGEAKTLAISVVSSGNNVDQVRDPDSLVFTGYGGTENYGGGVPSDQKLERSNLALKNAISSKTVVRVVREVDDPWRNKGSVYVYDGVYMVTDIREATGKNGYMVYKFMLVREPGQKPAFGLWKQIEEWKSGSTPRPQISLEDIAFGAEPSKIPLVNEVDDEEGLVAFAYVIALTHWLETVTMSQCTCRRRQCGKADGDCRCVERNGCVLPYTDKLLVARTPILYECGSSCCCDSECQNRVIQNGLKFKLEVFKTVECGWGLRSWDPIKAGSFICEYAGEVIKKGEEEDDDDFIFDSSRVYNSFMWNYEPELVGEKKSDQDPEGFYLEEPLVITAKKVGNVARFMNHSCQPNVLWQPMKHEINGKLFIRIGLFAMKHIPPMNELRFDYGVAREEGKKICLCASDFCRGFFG